jgi:hypothetical protein
MRLCGMSVNDALSWTLLADWPTWMWLGMDIYWCFDDEEMIVIAGQEKGEQPYESRVDKDAADQENRMVNHHGEGAGPAAERLHPGLTVDLYG